jgi:catechol 2,3-dioxygenase-like lactoylglutathione lyase family enzyme
MTDSEERNGVRIKTINHVGIPITDRKDSLPFYRDLLGLEVIPSMEDGASLIWTETEDHTMVHVIEGAPIPHIAFEVEDFDAALAAVRAAGIEIIKGPLERVDGQRAFYCFDPDGNRLEFTTARNLKPIPRKRVVDEWGRTTEV